MPPQQRTELVDVSDTSSIASKSTITKRFHFSLSSNEIYDVPHIDDMTPEEVKAIWYEKADYEKIKMAMIPVIRKMMKKETIQETDRETIRGLEFRTRQGAIRRQHNKLEATTAVLDEQDRQLDTVGRVDEDLLAKVYKQFNSHCQIEAHKLALGDVQPAKEHCADAIELVRRQYECEERQTPLRKPSFGKLMKQMRIRRRAVDDSEQPVAVVGQAA
jgi:hypothetical protein